MTEAAASPRSVPVSEEEAGALVHRRARPTSSDRTTARIVAVLFVVADVAAIVGGLLLAGPLTRSDALARIAASEGRVATGALLELVLALSVAGIGVLLFPVLRRRHEALALGYVGARLLESVLLLAASTSALVFLTLGREHGREGLVPLGDALVAGRDRTLLLGGLVMLGVSTVILNSLLLKGKLVPAWLASWGLASGVLVLVRGVLELYGLDPGLAQVVLTAPVAVYELALAVRLIARGFDEPAAALGGT